MLRRYWNGSAFEGELAAKEALIRAAIDTLARRHPAKVCGGRGLGMMQGIAFDDPADAAAVKALCFESQLLIETCGPRDEVLKLMPAR